ncbi:MAG: diguanylate cyclase, partial [Candidatus Omnitrophica bacterium]|nr:diguanylate cyclase [Candidatus Omnitrophota bacterium]
LTPVDKAGRFSDDEFALILPERNKKEAKDIADDVRGKISKLVVFQAGKEEKIQLTVSGGLSENPIDGSSAKELIDKAQSSLKEAKQAGKNIVKV